MSLPAFVFGNVSLLSLGALQALKEAIDTGILTCANIFQVEHNAGQRNVETQS